MLVKADGKKISFLFQETDAFFDMGCAILEQEHMEQMLPYKRKQQNGREKLIFRTDAGGIVRLADVVQSFKEEELLSVLYGLFSLNKKIEKNGFLKRECIWYQYEHIYYDKDQKRIMAAILPVVGEVKYADGVSWYGHFGETVTRIAEHLPQQKADHVERLVSLLQSHLITDEEAVRELGNLGCGVPGALSGQSGQDEKKAQKVVLRLLYSGQGARVEFEVGDQDFLIGRNANAANGVISEALSKAVSRKHCLIIKMQNKYFVQDLKSVNHTLVNGIMIPPYELMELEDNDILSVADMEFRVKKVIEVKT